MNYEKRRQNIVAALAAEGALSYSDLAKRMGVAEITIRHDVEALAVSGEVIRVLGGAQRVHAPPAFYETSLANRLQTNTRAKQVIARRALELIRPGMTLFIDGSTTCIELARVLNREREKNTIVTPSALVALELGCSRRHAVILLGGQFDPDSCCAVGLSAEESARSFHADLAIISTKGFLPAEGTFESVPANISIKRIAAGRSERVALLVDHAKFGVRALCRALRPEEIDVVVTDVSPSMEHRQSLKRSKIKVLVAGPGKKDGGSAGGPAGS